MEKKIFKQNAAVINAKISEVENSLPKLQRIQKSAEAIGLQLCDQLLLSPRAYIIRETKANVLPNGNAIAENAVVLAPQFESLIKEVADVRGVTLRFYIITADDVQINEAELDRLIEANTVYLDSKFEEAKHEFASRLCDLLNEWNAGGKGRAFGYGELSNFETPISAFVEMIAEVTNSKPWNFKPSPRFVKGRTV